MSVETMLLSLKTKLKLNETQEILRAKQAGIARFTDNWALANWGYFCGDGSKLDKHLIKEFFNNHVKPKFIWIKEESIRFSQELSAI